MNIAAYLVNWTGVPFGVLFGPEPLVRIAESSGVFEIVYWAPSLPAPPSPDQLAAAVAAPEPGPTPEQLLAYAAQKRFAVETGGITVGDSRVNTSRESQNMIANANAYVVASGAASVAYKADSGWVTLDAATIKAVALAVGAHVQACFALESTLDAGIIAKPPTITTEAGIDAAAWPA